MAKKLLLLGIMVVIGAFFLGACKSLHGIPEHGIPDGWYYHCQEDGERLGGSNDYGWSIKGDVTNYYSSGVPIIKCKVIVDNGQIFFQGNQVYGDKESVRFKIEYDAATKVLTVNHTDGVQYFIVD
ncbi:MAG: hypothetical protein FWE85_01385 [Clostridiales bacterium]|nr:hypothetical protein [Clostridiales bacterium]